MSYITQNQLIYSKFCEQPLVRVIKVSYPVYGLHYIYIYMNKIIILYDRRPIFVKSLMRPNLYVPSGQYTYAEKKS